MTVAIYKGHGKVVRAAGGVWIIAAIVKTGIACSNQFGLAGIKASQLLTVELPLGTIEC